MTLLVQKETVESIKEHFGLNHYEIKIWTALLARGIAAASELADISGVPRSRCYDVLESLEKKGFTIMKIGKPIKYIAVKPEEIVDRIKKSLNQETEINLQLLEVVRESEIFKELELLHKTGIEHIDPEELADTFYGKTEINRQIKKLAESAKNLITISTTKEGFGRKLRLLKNILPSKISSGVKVKITAPIDYKQAKEHEGSIRIKQADNKMRFVIADSKEIMLYLTHEGTEPDAEKAISVKSEFFGNALAELLNI